MRNHRTSAELQAIVGVDRSRHTSREVANAETELAIRTGSEEVAFDRKLQKSGTACLIVGALFILWPLAMLGMFTAMRDAPVPADPSAPFLFRHFSEVFVSVGILQVIAGVLLLFGGIGTKRRKRYGPRLIVAALGIGLAYVVVFMVLFLVSFALEGQPVTTTIVFAGFSVIMSALWAFLLWLPLRFFTSPRVREACIGTAG